MDFTKFQMVNRYERLQAVTQEEAERRFSLVRQIMGEQGVKATIFLNLYDSGMAWWLISSSSKIPDCVIVPMEGPVTAVYYSRVDTVPGKFTSRITPGRTPVQDDLSGRVVLKNEFDPQDIAHCYPGETHPRIGFVHGECLDVHIRDGLKSVFESYEPVELFFALEERKCLKSPFEMELCRESAKMHTNVLQAVPGILRRGRTLREVTSELHCLAMDLGSTGEDMCLMVHPLDRDGNMLPPSLEYPGYKFKDGDMVSILLETSGPGGLFTANARYWAFGQPSESFLARWKVAVEANDLVGKLLKPGISLYDIAEQVNTFIRGQGYYTDDCCYLHGMGYTMGEAPIKADHTAHQGSNWSEHMPMQVNMQTLAHPHVGYAGNQFTRRDDMVRCIDTYYVVPGGSVRATTASREITML